MNINHVLTQYDSMFGVNTLPEIELYLYQKITEAVGEQDDASIITLLNEMIGLCRDTSQKEKALVYCEQLKNLMVRMNMEGSKDYATSMQNIANAYRAFGAWDEAEEVFGLIEKTYETCLENGDYLWASMYNNWGLLYQEKQEYEKSVETLEKALSLIVQIPNHAVKEAITKTNLANSLFGLKTDEAVKKGYGYLTEALEVFIEDGETDFHYGAALVATGDYYAYRNRWNMAKEYYQKGLVEILIHTGKTQFYERVLEKYEKTITKINNINKKQNNLQQSKEFYEQYGKNMIHNQFPEYESRIAVGMVGEGSDCFGFDDEISTDHDYGVGFCMWLTKDDMEAIGKELQEAYHSLILEYHIPEHHIPVGQTKAVDSMTCNIPAGQKDTTDKMARLSERRGVFEIEHFFQWNTDESKENVNERKWNTDEYTWNVEENKLSEMVNGEIFQDELGLVTRRRNELLQYYPEELWRKKLANYLHEFSQYGQCNYARMMARNDYVTAGLCISKAIESAMDIGYVLCKQYAPYYKWKRRGLEKSREMQEIVWICEVLSQVPCQKKAWENIKYCSTRLNTDDRCVVLLETLAWTILEKLKDRNLVNGTDAFLENYIKQVLAN